MPADSQVTGRAGPQDHGRPRYRFRDGVWPVICGVMDWKTTIAAAADLGVSDTTISRAIAGETYPGEVLMAALMSRLEAKGWKHELVFEIVREPTALAVAS